MILVVNLSVSWALTLYIGVPYFLTITGHLAGHFDAHKIEFVNIQLSAICPPKTAEASENTRRTGHEKSLPSTDLQAFN